MKNLLLFLWLLTLAAHADTTVRIALVERGSAATVETDGGWTRKTPDGASVLQRLSGPVRLKAGEAPGLLVPKSGTFYLGGRGYRGYLKIVDDGGKVTLVNVLPLEQYLAGVLGGEIPASWPAATQRALAVAARTYATYLLQDPRHAEYDLVATDQDQVYAGLDGESASSRSALAATRGEVLVHSDGRVLKAYYSSNCGGHTEDAAQVFGPKVPPIRAVKDPYCPPARWSRTFTLAEVRAKLARDGKPLKGLKSVEITRKNRSGRIEEIAILDQEGQEVRLNGQEFRRIMGYRELRSTRCTMTASGDRLRFEGNGWGHGVGLCQWGALEMGEQGQSYRQILAHYYRDAKIEKR